MDTIGEVFTEYVARHKQLIENAVLTYASRPLSADGQGADLDRYLYGPLVRFVSAGGKRIRPALCLLGAEAAGAPPERALSAAVALELFQTAALIHDDIADASATRRGEACLHVREGVGLAVNIGDLALVQATSVVLQDPGLPATTRLHLLEELCSMEEHTTEGQALDIGWARDGRWDLSTTDYLSMARSKTAYYSAASPLAMGALCAGADVARVEGLRRFGLRCGLAFQIQDDLLNLVGDATAQGKDFRSDITEGKRTLVMIWALEHLDASGHAELVSLLSGKVADAQALERAVELAELSGAIEHARAYARELVASAQSDLAELDVAPEAREVLLSMSDFFIARTR